MIRNSIQFNETSVKLVVEGLPDFSRGHDERTIGIISNWKLDLIGSPVLEGQRVHLESLMTTVLKYGRYLISNSARPLGEIGNSVRIIPKGDQHELLLQSTRDSMKTLAIQIDDAELVDLVRCLESLRNDPRIQIDWNVPIYAPLNRRELANKSSFWELIAAPFVGILAVSVTVVIAAIMPISTTQSPLQEPSPHNTQN